VPGGALPDADAARARDAPPPSRTTSSACPPCRLPPAEPPRAPPIWTVTGSSSPAAPVAAAGAAPEAGAEPLVRLLAPAKLMTPVTGAATGPSLRPPPVKGAWLWRDCAVRVNAISARCILTSGVMVPVDGVQKSVALK